MGDVSLGSLVVRRCPPTDLPTTGRPLGDPIPDQNHLIARGEWSDQQHAILPPNRPRCRRPRRGEAYGTLLTAGASPSIFEDVFKTCRSIFSGSVDRWRPTDDCDDDERASARPWMMMERDDNIVVFGEDGYFRGVFRCNEGLQTGTAVRARHTHCRRRHHGAVGMGAYGL